ncbi:MAG: endolytic transglycosylase MltG, partial [Ruminococcaceae bacterium]|nr:endolytic transglycosylase MltG [Oscillospiraceae bacterium]
MKIKTTKKKNPVYRAPSTSAVKKRTVSAAPEREPRERRERRSGGVSVGMILIIILCVCLVGGMVGFGVVISEISGDKYAAFATQTEIDIPEGSSTEAIGDILKENEMIDSVNIFKVYCRLKGIDGTFQPGPHTFD